MILVRDRESKYHYPTHSIPNKAIMALLVPNKWLPLLVSLLRNFSLVNGLAKPILPKAATLLCVRLCICQLCRLGNITPPFVSSVNALNKANGKNGKAIVCAAMRKLIHLSFTILKSGQPFDPNFA